jgi:F-type H+-transporting ATPase subunit a
MTSIAPEVVFTILGIPVRNTIVSTWVMMAVIIVAAAIAGRFRPSYLELLFDFLNDTISDILGEPAGHILPFLGSLALFILFANLIGVIPGLTTPTADLNTPIALALVVFLSIHYLGIKKKGVWGYLKDLASPIYLLPIELISQLTRTVSLTVRLFGNMLSSDFLVVVILSILPVFVPLPMIGLQIFDGLLQAYIFTALATVYIAGAIMSHESGPKKEKKDKKKKKQEKLEAREEVSTNDTN